MTRLLDALVAKRYVFGLFGVLMAGLGAWGLNYTTMESGYNAILSEDDPYRAEVEQARRDFPPSTNVLFVFESNIDVFNFPTLRAMDELTNRYSEIDGAIAVGSLMNRRLNAVDAQRFDRDYLIPALDTLTAADLPGLKRLSLQDEDLTKSLLAPKGDMALAVVKYRVADEQAARLDVARSVIRLRDDLRQAYPGVDIYVLGGVLFELDGYRAQIRDSQVLFPVTIAIGIVLLWFCLKSFTYALALFVVAFVAVAVATGSYGWAGISFNQISTLGPIVVLVIAIAHGIHIVSVYAQGLHEGMDKLVAMGHSLAVNIQPVTLATITTSMGFLSLNYASSPGIYGFGNIVALGTWWAYLFTLVLLPTIILWLPINRVPKPLGVQGFIREVTSLVLARPGRLLVFGAVLVVTTLLLLPLNKLDFNRYSFVDKESDFHYVMSALREKIGNDQSLVYSISAGEYYGITELEFLRVVDEFSLWLEAQPDTSFVTSYTDLLRALNKSEHDDDEAWNILPEDKLQIIDYLVGYQLIQEIEPNLEPIFNADYSAVRLLVGTSNLTNGQLIDLSERIDTWVADHVPTSYEVLHGDNFILFARQDRAITLELAKGFSLSFVLITLTLIIGLKSWRYGLLSIMPNLFPATIVFGFWGLFVGELSPYILMLFSISIGIVVDDSVHILSKYISARREGQPPREAVRYSLDKAGSAITITTLALAVGTFVLVLSNTFHFQNVALLLTPIVLVALLLDLFCLPPLLVKFDEWRSMPVRRR